MLNILYNFVFKPIELLVMFTYLVMNKIFDNKGIAIIAVSIVIQTVVLPIYKRADAVQNEERIRQEKMSKWVKHIKKAFKGDEKYMMLSTYYREMNYKSWYALRSSASILLQVPFFVAAYNYLSNLPELSGVAFLFIKDLGAPDRTFNVGGFYINVLPCLMTFFNVISGVLYTKGQQLRDKVQVYGLAAIFLVLLYNSPSGLVLYWTMNNLYSLLKNFVLKVIKVNEDQLLVEKMDESKGQNEVDDGNAFVLSCLFVALFIGALIPLNVVNSSATEFINAEHGPLYLVLINFSLFSGIFLLWGGIFYFFAKDRFKKIMYISVTCFSASSVINYMLFGNRFGIMSPLFVYEGRLQYSAWQKLLDLMLIVIASVIIIVMIYKCPKVHKRVLNVMVISTLCMSVIVGVSVAFQVNGYYRNISKQTENDRKVFNLSKNAKNVVVIMLDRAISGYVPYIFDEKPEIAGMYEGFCYYPNTLSFGGATNFGAPALFGGYEYSVEGINARKDISLKDKNNEALLVMPALFSENGYEVTVTDPPYAGTYRYVPDLSMYDKYKNVRALMTEGKYMDGIEPIYTDSYQKSQESRAFYYCLMRALPVVLSEKVYNGGTYYSHLDIGVNLNFLRDYSVLQNMINLTDVSDTNENHCIIMQNGTTHDISPLSVPDYEPVVGAENRLNEFLDYYDNHAFSREVKGLKFSNINQIAHYQSNVAALMAIGKWFDYLRANDCWNNTRIIIVSDHGYSLGDLEKTQLANGLDIERYNPLLLVKDFESDSFKVSDEFMTNADVPAIAMEGLIDRPVNPFTGNLITNSKKANRQIITTSGKSIVADNDGNTFDTSDGVWYEVTPGDIFDDANWSMINE